MHHVDGLAQDIDVRRVRRKTNFLWSYGDENIAIP